MSKRRLVCENSRFSVFFDEIASGGRTAARDYLVVAPKRASNSGTTGVAVLPVVDGRIGLIRTYRHAVACESWEIPRGFIEDGEADAVSAVRELEEETGLSCSLRNIRSLGFVVPDAGVLAARVHLFSASKCFRSRPFRTAEWGHREFSLFDLATLRKMVACSKIQDPCTLIAYYKFLYPGRAPRKKERMKS
ncbi:MAG TPA: NUDIX hydrolase [candidate division Zixibacteria bacterium]|nr:NUDIX hydrolase [candidate division Zixibacteria bacterium]